MKCLGVLGNQKKGTVRLRLKIEPIPNSTWGISLANKLPPNEWKDIRQKIYRDADYRCEICGSNNGSLHCHEVWIFDDRRRIQHLAKFECCCELCHDVHHFGRTSETRAKSYVERCIGHWCNVNKKNRNEFMAYLQEIKALNIKRANKQYIVKVGRRILY